VLLAAILTCVLVASVTLAAVLLRRRGRRGLERRATEAELAEYLEVLRRPVPEGSDAFS
jgi:hypothetical protein